MGGENLADPAIEAFDHAVGLVTTGRNQAMVDLLLCADLVVGVAAGRLAFALRREVVSEFLIFIGEETLNFERGGLEKGLVRVGALVGFHRHIDPAGSP